MRPRAILLSTVNAHRYHLKDVIVGKIYFLLVRIKIKHMELSIIRRETTGTRAWASPNTHWLSVVRPERAQRV